MTVNSEWDHSIVQYEIDLDENGKAYFPISLYPNTIYTIYVEQPTTDLAHFPDNKSTVFEIFTSDKNEIAYSRQGIVQLPSTFPQIFFNTLRQVVFHHPQLVHQKVHVTVSSTKALLSLQQRIDTLMYQNACLEDRIHELEQKMNEMYYSPDMNGPGYIAAKLSFFERAQRQG